MWHTVQDCPASPFCDSLARIVLLAALPAPLSPPPVHQSQPVVILPTSTCMHERTDTGSDTPHPCASPLRSHASPRCAGCAKMSVVAPVPSHRLSGREWESARERERERLCVFPLLNPILPSPGRDRNEAVCFGIVLFFPPLLLLPFFLHPSRYCRSPGFQRPVVILWK